MDLPELVRQYASENAVAAMAGTLGEPVQRVSAATSAAIPSILSFYVSKACHPDGADLVFESLHDRSPSILDRLPDSLSGEGAYSLVDEGSSQFTKLFGRDALDGLSHATSSFSGLGISSSRSVIGVLNAIVLATVSKHSNAQSGHELATFLSESRAPIADSIPAGLHEYLDEIPNIREVVYQYDEGVSATSTDDGMENEAAIPRQENVHNQHYYDVDQSEKDRAASLAWVIPLLIVIAVGAALIYTLMPARPGQQAQPVAVAPPSGAPVEPQAMPAGATITPSANALSQINPEADPTLGRDLGQLVDRFSQTLRGQDAAASQQEYAAIDKELTPLSDRFRRLPQDQQRHLAASLNQQMPALQRDANQRQVPAAQKIVQQLQNLANQPTPTQNGASQGGR